MHQQEVLEKNFKSQLREESKKRKSIVEELRKAERKIDDLGKLITVIWCGQLLILNNKTNPIFVWFQEKDKLINRLNIYSRGRTLPQLKPSELASSQSLTNLNLFDDESVVTRLDKKLKERMYQKDISNINKNTFPL